MENKLLLRSRISLVRIRTQIKNKIHAIIDRNKDCYNGLENLTDIFGKTGMGILKDTQVPEPDYMILKNYIDLISNINKDISCFCCSKSTPLFQLKSTPLKLTFLCNKILNSNYIGKYKGKMLELIDK